MNICHSPRKMAPRKATKATQKWARTSFLARNTAQPFSATSLGEELCGRQHLHSSPHGFVACAAVFVTGHEVLARLAEGRRERGDEARDEHRVGVRGAHDEAVDGIGCRAPERD